MDIELFIKEIEKLGIDVTNEKLEKLEILLACLMNQLMLI